MGDKATQLVIHQGTPHVPQILIGVEPLDALGRDGPDPAALMAPLEEGTGRGAEMVRRLKRPAIFADPRQGGLDRLGAQIAEPSSTQCVRQQTGRTLRRFGLSPWHQITEAHTLDHGDELAGPIARQIRMLGRLALGQQVLVPFVQVVGQGLGFMLAEHQVLRIDHPGPDPGLLDLGGGGHALRLAAIRAALAHLPLAGGSVGVPEVPDLAPENQLLRHVRLLLARRTRPRRDYGPTLPMKIP
jgi:hypothetical protein